MTLHTLRPGLDAPGIAPLSEASPRFWVRDVPVYGEALLAPMDGYSEWPYRSLCAELGSAMSYTEFVKARHIVRAYEHMAPRLTFEEAERPVVFQIWGEDPAELLEAALRVQDRSPDIIDINLGCPAKSVASLGAGVGLMRTPLKIARIFRTLSARLEVPLTAKIRLGWEDCRSYKLVARILEENGAALVALHARTKEQGYGGEADWEAIREVKSMVKIPVIGNGDVRTVRDIDRMRSETGCDAVMIGRAAIGNPWIFSRLERDQVPREAVRRMMHRHLERSLEFHGPHKGLVLFRKHALRYLKLQRLPRAERTVIFTQDTPEKFMAALDEVFAGLGG